MSPAPVLAAGAVVLRRQAVLLVHRPRYDDWSFPKGKLDHGEHLTACAVREVREESGLDVHLTQPLTEQEYLIGRRRKRVHYWIGRVVGDPSVDTFVANTEVDRVAWVPVAEAARLLTYAHDRATLAEAAARRDEAGGHTRPLVVLRHGKARSRSGWRTDDRFRPLVSTGEQQARRIAPVLGAYDVAHLVSSSSTRCITTLLPYADLTGREIDAVEELSERGATAPGVERIVRQLLAGKRAGVLCSHRPVLPHVFAALGVDDPGLEVGEMLVVHHRDARVLAVERHLP